MKKLHSLTPLRINFITLGCAKNLIDTEKILALLVQAGMALVGSDDQADVTIINTCGFIAEAREEARENINYALEQKRNGRIGHIVVTGCLAQYWGEKLADEFPGIDTVAGLTARENIAEIVKKTAQKAPVINNHPPPPLIYNERFDHQIFNDQVRLRITEPCWAYLRISEGCDRDCTFCTIPAIRGPFRSKPPEAVLAEAEELIADGAVELNLIAQETSSYGIDLGYDAQLAGLLRELNRIEGLQWLRILYTHPATITDAQIAAMAQCEKVVPYLDIPLQHINSRILKLMNRRIDRTQTELLLAKLRESINSLSLRTTMLVGFPSETESEFTELLDFVREFRFEALGCFKYSAEEHTPAAKMRGQLSEEVKQERLERLMLAQQEIAFEHLDSLIDNRLDCLIISEAPPEIITTMEPESDRKWFIARHTGQAPEIDSECYLADDIDSVVEPGAIVSAKIIARSDYDLIGKIQKGTANNAG